jgi:hypothetical protein
MSLLAWLIWAATPVSVSANEVDALRRELEQLKQTMQAIQERIQRLEATPAPAAVEPVAAPASASPSSTAGGQPALLELARPREPFALSERRGAGQLLFDIGIVGDFVGNLVQRNVEKAQAGTFPGRENRLFPREVEINLFGRIDPYAEGHVRFEFAEEFEDGERTTQTKLAEAHLTLLTLPFGTKLSLGQVPVRFGLLSHLHREALPQPDSPNVLVRFLGEEQFRESGVELSWLPALPFYLEALLGVFNGDNEVAFGRGSLKAPLVTARLRTFLELGESSALQVGISGATGETEEKRRSTLAGFDLKYKLTPEGWRHSLFTLGGEALYSNRKIDVFGDPDGDGAVTGESRTRQRFGWYAWGEVQPWKRWVGGVRYDRTQFPVDPGNEWAVEPYVAFVPSDFLRFRLGYKHTERSHRVTGPDDRGSARILDELLFQATFFLGAHQAHPF